MQKKIVAILTVASLFAAGCTNRAVALDAQSAPASGYNAKADYNIDGRVDAQDASAFAIAYAAAFGSVITPTTTPVPPATPEPTLPTAPTDTSTPLPSATSTSTLEPTASQTPTPTLTSTSTPLPSATPQPTFTPTPLATPTIPPVANVAGQPCAIVDTMSWHPAVDPVSGCYYQHEHGDAPPAWLSNTVVISVPLPMFMHSMNTSAFENNEKHPCMKGFLLGGDPVIGQNGLIGNQIKTGVTAGPPSRAGYAGWQVYSIYHACANPPDRLSQYHSLQWWAKDPTGAISWGNSWIDTGNPKYYADGGTRVETSVFDQPSAFPATNSRPIVRVDWGTTPICEQWYQFGGGLAEWIPDTGLTICNTPTNYNAIERARANGTYTGTLSVYDGGDWSLTGGKGGDRNFEWVQYADRIRDWRGAFWHDQFGVRMSGPADPLCGAIVSRGTFTGKRLCSLAYIAPTLYSEMLKVTTFSAGQFAPREQHQYVTTGIAGPRN